MTNVPGPAATRLAAEMGEDDPRAQLRIDLVIHLLGEDKSELLLAKAKTIHMAEGMKRTDGVGYRTLGGIFFHLAKESDPRIRKAFREKSARSATTPAFQKDLTTLLREIAKSAASAADQISKSNADSTVSTTVATKILGIRPLLDCVVARIAPADANAVLSATRMTSSTKHTEDASTMTPCAPLRKEIPSLFQVVTATIWMKYKMRGKCGRTHRRR